MPLWLFENVVCHSAPYSAFFVAPRCSAAYGLYLFCLASLVLLPLFATFASDNVWVSENSYNEQPFVSFRHELLVVLAGSSADDSVGWSTNADLSPLLPPLVRVPVVRSSSLDNNHDGLPDTWTLSLQMPKVNNGYQRVFLMAAYNLELRERVREIIGGLVVVDINNIYPATGVWVQGQLRLKQGLPLRVESETRDVYSESPFSINQASNWATANQPITARALLQRYAARNETVFFDQHLPPVWDYGPRDSFDVELVLDVPPQVVRYVPRVLEMLKFAWMQVLSFLVPTWLALRSAKAFAYDGHLVETYVVPQLPPKDEW